MSMTFTKLFSSITESTIWVEDAHTRLVWITMLAMSDRRGRVWGSIPGLANRARVPVADCETAINKFLAPDKYSRTRTPECEGRRIVEIDGGWRLINYKKYRDIRDKETVREQTAARVAKHRAKKRDVTHVTHGNTKVTPNNDNVSASASAFFDPDLDLEVFTDPESARSMSGSTSEPRRPVNQKRQEQAEAACRVLGFLNDKTGRNYRPTSVNLDKIAARLREGYTETQCRQVIVKKCREWMPDEKMAVYLRPATLFGREKFNQYAGELGQREVSHDFG